MSFWKRWFQKSSDWECGIELARRGKREEAIVAFGRAIDKDWNCFRWKRPDEGPEFECWFEAACQRIDSKVAKNPLEQRLWRAVLRKDETAIVSEGMPVLGFLIERAKENPVALPAQVFDIVVGTATAPALEILQKVLAKERPTGLMKATLRKSAWESLLGLAVNDQYPASLLFHEVFLQTDPRATECLIACLGMRNESGQPDPAIVSAVSSALSVLGDSRAVTPLLAILEEPIIRRDRNTLNSISSLLGKCGNETAVNPLIKLLGEGGPDTRNYASTALERILDRLAPQLSEDCLRRLASLTHESQIVASVSEEGRDDQHTWLQEMGVDVHGVKRRANDELFRRGVLPNDSPK